LSLFEKVGYMGQLEFSSLLFLFVKRSELEGTVKEKLKGE